MLACTICGIRPAFGKVRLEITQGAATYLVCPNSPCIQEACQRAADNLWRAATRTRTSPRPSAVEARTKALPRKAQKGPPPTSEETGDGPS
jgi:hypothetical protein